jgi:hypothetical protein
VKSGPPTTRWLAGALAGILIVVVLWMTHGGGLETVGQRMPDEGQGHVPAGTPVTYGHDPPTSGPHWPSPAPWGEYDQEIRPEVWVHNLEHGGIVILHRCDIPCPELVQQLRDVHTDFPKSKYGHVKLLIAPYRKLRTRLAILAWTWIDELETFDRERLLRFYRAHLDRGPEDVP